MDLRRTRLVVLAACTTAGGAIRRGEGILSLARPFLAAGVPSVVATLWDIDDHASVAFFADFHARLAAGGQPARALRAAQLSAIATTLPSVWAAPILVGDPEGWTSSEND